jgi:hypothetical protein
MRRSRFTFFSNSRSTTEYLKQVSSYFCFHGDLLKMRFTFSGAARLHDYFDKNNSFARLFPQQIIIRLRDSIS